MRQTTTKQKQEIYSNKDKQNSSELKEEMGRDEEMKGNTNGANKAAIMHTVNRTQI